MAGSAVPGIEELRRADEILRRDGDSVPGDMTLRSGASAVWSAMYEVESWPAELQAQADELLATLFRHGPIWVTVERMGRGERLVARRQLLQFIACAERLNAPEGVTARVTVS